MIIECPGCHARYRYDEQRFAGKPSKKIRCARCREVFQIERPLPGPIGGIPASSANGQAAADRDSRQAEASPAVDEPLQLPRGKRLSIAILAGAGAGNVFRIEKPQITIGRSDADLTLDDSEASRHHAVIEVRESGCTLRDLDSRNGTFAAGEKISGAVELGDKSEFQIGNTTLMLIVTTEL